MRAERLLVFGIHEQRRGCLVRFRQDEADRSRGCDGFRVESARGLIGWIEETWLGPANESTALALRMLDGRRGLLVIDDVEAVASERELVVVRSEARVLELDVPRIAAVAGDGGRPAHVSASWTTTGELLKLSDWLAEVGVTHAGIESTGEF